MPESSGTYLENPSAASSETLELKAVIAVLAQRLDELTAKVDGLDPEPANQRALKQQQEDLAARSRQAAAEAETQRKSAIQAESRLIARELHGRTPLASQRSISKLYESGRLTRGTYGEQETVEELKRLGWTD